MKLAKKLQFVRSLTHEPLQTSFPLQRYVNHFSAVKKTFTFNVAWELKYMTFCTFDERIIFLSSFSIIIRGHIDCDLLRFVRGEVETFSSAAASLPEFATSFLFQFIKKNDLEKWQIFLQASQHCYGLD